MLKTPSNRHTIKFVFVCLFFGYIYIFILNSSNEFNNMIKAGIVTLSIPIIIGIDFIVHRNNSVDYDLRAFLWFWVIITMSADVDLQNNNTLCHIILFCAFGLLLISAGDIIITMRRSFKMKKRAKEQNDKIENNSQESSESLTK